MNDYEDMGEIELTDAENDLDIALRKQDEALALLERLRVSEPALPKEADASGGGRRDFRRWPAPEGVTVELYDGRGWHVAPSSDLGVGGARLAPVPAWLDGPVPVRLRGVTGPAVLMLGDLMWRDTATNSAGLRFEFADAEDHDLWTSLLIDALLARYALGQ